MAIFTSVGTTRGQGSIRIVVVVLVGLVLVATFFSGILNFSKILNKHIGRYSFLK